MSNKNKGKYYFVRNEDVKLLREVCKKLRVEGKFHFPRKRFPLFVECVFFPKEITRAALKIAIERYGFSLRCYGGKHIISKETLIRK